MQEQERLIALYEKGVLTKEEAQACYIELGGEAEADAIFLTETKPKPLFGLTLPSFKVFSSTRHQQEFSFDSLSAMSIRLNQGKITFSKHKKAHIQVNITYSQGTKTALLPQLYVEDERLHFDGYLPCQLSVFLPECWLSVLELEVGQADVRLDYLPFEDVSVRSQLDKKQQDIRLTPFAGKNQHIRCQLQTAPISFFLTQQQGVKGTFISATGRIIVNRKQQSSPCFCEKKGENHLHVQVETLTSPIYLKGVRHASRMVSSTKE